MVRLDFELRRRLVQLHVDEFTARPCIEAKRKRARIAMRGLDSTTACGVAEGMVDSVREANEHGGAKRQLVSLYFEKPCRQTR